MESMFSTMLRLPLFQGLCQEDFTNILGRVKLHFTKHKPGELFIREGSLCNELVFLLKGKMAMSTTSPDESFTFIEYIDDTHLIEPYSLFGLNTQYVSSYMAETEVQILRISKEFVVRDLFKYEIFRMNFTNYISNRVQALTNKIWLNTPNQIEQKIIHFILMHSEKVEGEKILRIKMDDLARHLDNTRLNVSKGLNELQERGVLVLHRKEIVVPDGGRLIRAIHIIRG
ncbi:Crp/Fnr family transcriptional regulator [Bacteroides sp. 224]|uniref:Crp/Fnr family transcriptional regulator n=1 Tax=Bacteroides sp. 224 TaxID=2302936 RepID=UPI0013D4F431|nr:Crp/Fnr family transcriptional regulator [Bacteroides sp. 224]NDV64954.1 Crp/Fnr family transcriptional regulator [Bacteroides sp. 224]